MELLLTSVRLTRATHWISRTGPTRSIATSPPRTPFFSPPPPARRNYEYILPEPTPDKRDTRSKVTIDRRPTNNQIPFDHVFVVDPETNKLSSTKMSLKELLETRERRIVELVASTPKPIVRITTRSEIEARYREMKRVLKKGAKMSEEPKEVQLTWGVAKADLEHKLRKAKRDLEKGYRVVVVVLMKRGHRPSNHQELVAFADEISESLCEIGKEWKEREFSDRSMVLSFRRIEDAP